MKNIFKLALLFTIVSSCTDEPGALQTNPQIENSLKLAVTNNNVPADNYSYAEIKAIIKTNKSNDVITFTTDKGVFANNTNTYTVGIATTDTIKAYIKYNKTDLVRITAKIADNFTKETFTSFVPAYPTNLIINPDASSIAATFTSSSIITSNLMRLDGTVTEGMVIQYHDSIATPLGGSIGVFLNNTYSDNQGHATVKYWLQNNTYQGFVYIKGVIDTPAGKVKGESRIYVQ